MLPITFKGHNLILKKPEGWKDEECSDLPVARVLCADEKTPAIVSCWKPSYEDLQILNDGGGVYLTIIGAETHPPLSLSTENPIINL